MKKTLISLFVIGIFLTLSGVFAQTDLSEELDEFVKKVAERKGISEAQITNITEVDMNNLPNEVNIGNIDDTNIALYQIDSKNNKPAFVITFSDKGFKKTSIPSVGYTTSLLHFGIEKEMNDSVFLKTATGVSGDLNKGYVMLRKGSITGISTNLEVVKGSGEIQIIIYKNNEEIGFRNLVDVSTSGIKKDYDIQSRDIVEFEPGDTISVYTKVNGEITWKDAITIIEISSIGN
tara:strand:- start:7743 stop:8444 length:702 start_codon:yes stop_codon:yes gene_type:complete